MNRSSSQHAQVPSNTVIIVDKAALGVAMRKWFNNNASDEEVSWLLQAGYLKLPTRRGQSIGATAKGWEAAKAPYTVS